MIKFAVYLIKMFGLVAGIIIGVLFGLYVFWTVYCIVKDQRFRRRVAAKGKRVKGWYVQANQKIFEPGKGSQPALIVFSFDERANQHPTFLDQVANNLFRLKTEEPRNDVEKSLMDFTRDEQFISNRRRKLPEAFTKGVEVYCADVLVERDNLPDGILRDRFSYFMAIPGDEKSGVFMIPGPDGKPFIF